MSHRGPSQIPLLWASSFQLEEIFSELANLKKPPLDSSWQSSSSRLEKPSGMMAKGLRLSPVAVRGIDLPTNSMSAALKVIHERDVIHDYNISTVIFWDFLCRVACVALLTLILIRG